MKKKSSWPTVCLVTLKIGCGNQDIFQRPQKSRNGNPFSTSYPGLSYRVGNMETWTPRHGVVPLTDLVVNSTKRKSILNLYLGRCPVIIIIVISRKITVTVY